MKRSNGHIADARIGITAVNPAPLLVNGASVASGRNSTLYRYDEHGRVKAIIRPGDTDAAPTFAFAYELADPASRIVTQWT